MRAPRFHPRPPAFRSAVVIAATAVMAGCGGDGPSNPTTPPPAGVTTDIAGWRSLHPIPVGTSLYKVRFASATRAFAIGVWGVILRSNDAGVSWGPVRSNVESTLLGVAFWNASLGVAVGGRQTILVTRDGGTNWDVNGTGANIFFYDAAFVDANTIVAVGRAASEPAFAVTEDAGETWTLVDVTLPANASNEFWSVAPLPNGTVIVSNPLVNGGQTDYLHRTSDLGRTFSSQAMAFSPYRLAFADDDVGLVVSGGAQTLYRSVNGGATWTSAGINAVGDVFFVDDITGFTLTSPGIHKTTDKGATWTFTAQTGVIPGHLADGNTGAFLGGSPTTYFTTTDGGVTLAPHSRLPLAGEPVLQSFVGANVGYVVVDAGVTDLAIARTDDGGETWVTTTVPGAASGLAAAGARDVFALNSQRAWVANLSVGGFSTARTTIRRTDDGGQSWSEQATLLGTYHAIRFLNANRGFAIGFDDALYTTILETLDGGVTWSRAFVDSGTTFLSVTGSIAFSPGQQTGVAFTDSRMLVTRDGGSSWLPIAPPGGQQYDIQLLDDDTWVLATGADVLRSTDSGFTWTPVGVSEGERVSFRDAKNGMAVADASAIGTVRSWRTTDGGITWEPGDFLPAPRQSPGGSMLELQYVSPSVAYAISNCAQGCLNQNALMKTTTGGR